MKKNYLILCLLLICASIFALASTFIMTREIYEEPLSLYTMPETAIRELPPTPTRPPEIIEEIYFLNDFPSLFITAPKHPFQQDRSYWQRDSSLTMTNTSPEFQFTDVDVRVRGRGNTTWIYGPDKRPLRIRFETPQPMLGSEYPHRDWILLANHFDRSLLRNHGAKYLGNLLTGMPWTPSSQFVHLYINGEYYGVYELTEERDVIVGRIELTHDPDPTISEYSLELNNHVIGWRASEFEEGVDYFELLTRAYQLRWPSGNLRNDGHFEYVHNYIQRTSNAIREHNWREITNLIDIPSFIDFYIVQELFKNADIARFSVFMQIRGQGDNRRLYLGPVWDFDQSSGNNEYVESPEGRLVERDNYWYNYLMQIPAFKQAVTERWDEVKLTYIPQTIEHIYYMATTFEDSFNRNFERHPYIMGDIFEWNWVHSYATAEIDTFIGQAEFLIDFLTLRKQWIDDFLHDRLPESEEEYGE